MERGFRGPASFLNQCQSPTTYLQSRIRRKNFTPYQMAYHFRGEDRGHAFGTEVTYLTERGRKEHEVFVNCEGQFVDHEGHILNSPQGMIDKAIFAIDEEGRMFVSHYQQVGRFQHSSLVAGGNVLLAGEILFINGHIAYISNQSGHYHPHARSLDLFIDVLEELDVKIGEVDSL